MVRPTRSWQIFKLLNHDFNRMLQPTLEMLEVIEVKVNRFCGWHGNSRLEYVLEHIPARGRWGPGDRPECSTSGLPPQRVCHNARGNGEMNRIAGNVVGL